MTTIEVVNLRGYLSSVPCVSVVIAIVASHLQGFAIVARNGNLRTSVAHIARTRHYEHASCLAVTHHGSITMTLVVASVAESLYGTLRRSPYTSSVLAVAHLYADVAHGSHVAPTGGVRNTRTVVSKGYDVFAVSNDGRYTIILVARGVGLPEHGLCPRSRAGKRQSKSKRELLHLF